MTSALFSSVMDTTTFRPVVVAVAVAVVVAVAAAVVVAVAAAMANLLR